MLRISARARRVATRKRWNSLGILAEANARILRLELAQRAIEHEPELLSQRRIRPGCGVGGQVEDPHQLRLPVGALGAGTAELPGQAVEIVIVAIHKLDLELGEVPCRMTVVEDVDGVERHVGERALTVGDPHAGPMRPERRYRRELAVTEMRLQQCGQLGRRAGGATGSLELVATVLTRQLQLPARQAVLDTSAESDAAPRAETAAACRSRWT